MHTLLHFFTSSIVGGKSNAPYLITFWDLPLSQGKKVMQHKMFIIQSYWRIFQLLNCNMPLSNRFFTHRVTLHVPEVVIKDVLILSDFEKIPTLRDGDACRWRQVLVGLFCFLRLEGTFLLWSRPFRGGSAGQHSSWPFRLWSPGYLLVYRFLVVFA